MPISISSGGSGRPWIRFSPAANAWMKAGEGGSVEFDPKTSGMLIDVERLVMGWLTLSEGSREWEAWPSLTARTKQPSPEAKTGFVVNVFAPKLLGDEVYEFSSNATASTRFIESLYNQAEAGFGQGKVPLVKITGTKPIKIGKGTTREVEFTFSWVDRPAKLAEIDATPQDEAPKAAPKAAAKQMADADAEF